MTPNVYVLTQPSTAYGKDIYVHTGWRPAMVLGMSPAGIWCKADGYQDGDENALALPATSNGVGDDDAQDICRLMDGGFKLDSSATYIRVNSQVMRILAIPPGDAGPFKATLGATLPTYQAPYGMGDQFDATPQDSNPNYWISREA